MFDCGENQQVHVSQERVLASPSRFIDVTDGDLLKYFIGRCKHVCKNYQA